MNHNLTIGALVQCTIHSTDYGYGVITEMDHRKISVRWDAGDNARQFSADDPPLKRVELAQKRCKRRSTDETVVAMAPISTGAPIWMCMRQTKGFASINIPEYDLRPIPITEPVERVENDMIGSLKKYRLREVTQWYLWQHHNNDLVSLGDVRVDIKEHQVGVVHKVVSNYPHRFLLCDEVGLGKTIEAGMALKELRIRGGAQRTLIIVPPNLARQWQFEMKTKFNEIFAILNTDTVRYEENRGEIGNPFARHDSVICSSSWVSRGDWADLCAEADWDLIIVDEAHHVRMHEDGRTTLLYNLVNELATRSNAARRSLLLLTATPMQLGTHEIYALVELCDPVLFPSPEDFEKHRNSVPGLNSLVESLRSLAFSDSDSDFEEVVERVSQWLEIEKQHARRRLTAGSGELDVIADELSDRHLLTEVMIRNRKSVIGGFMPRVAARWEVEPSHEEREALKVLEEYIQYGFNLASGKGGNTFGFVMVTFQKLMASSIAAIKRSLYKRRDTIRQRYARDNQSENELDERLDNDSYAGDVVESVGVSEADIEIAYIQNAINALDRVKADSKSETLLKQMGELRAEDPDQKVLIFTQFRETQDFLAELLYSNGWEVNLFHGQMRDPRAKDRAVERFRDNKGPQVLISTEAGGEGRNFQFCHTLVNYDLPWNPMRVEQRIGRVDRIGQEHEVRIFNLFTKDTIEERVLDVLERRINVFEETVGGLDPILGETENDIKKIMRMATGAREAALENLGADLELKVRRAREASDLFGDFIMDTKSFSREIAERIAGQPSPVNNDDMDRYIGQLLSDVRTYIRQNGDAYELTFRDHFVEKHKDLFAAGNKLNAVFRPDRRADSEHVEFMAFGNPIVDAIVENALAEGYDGATGSRRILAGDDIAPTSGWLFTYIFTVNGARSTEHLLPIFVSDDGVMDTELGQRITERACLFDRAEQEIPLLDIPSNVGAAKALVDAFVENKRQALEDDATEQADVQVTQEVDRLTKYFDYRERSAVDKLRSEQDTLDNLPLGTAQQRQVVPIFEARVRAAEAVLNDLPEERKRRIVEAEKFRYPVVSYSLKSLGRIEVVENMDA